MCDEAKELYSAFGLRRGSVRQLLGMAVWMAGLNAYRAGHRPGLPQGDTFLMSGHFLVDREHVLREWVHENAGQPIDVDAVLEIVHDKG